MKKIFIPIFILTGLLPVFSATTITINSINKVFDAQTNLVSADISITLTDSPYTKTITATFNKNDGGSLKVKGEKWCALQLKTFNDDVAAKRAAIAAIQSTQSVSTATLDITSITNQAANLPSTSAP